MIRGKHKGPMLLRAIAVMVMMLVLIGLITLDVSSEAEPSWVEKRLASTFLEAKVRLKAPPTTSPLKSPSEDVIVGSEMYRAQCSFCHGGMEGTEAPLAKSFSPRPLQFGITPSQRPEWMNAYVIRHGIRWTAMPAFSNLSEGDAWRIATFLEVRARSKAKE